MCLVVEGDLHTEERWVDRRSLVLVSSWTTAVNTGPLLVLLVVKVTSPPYLEGLRPPPDSQQRQAERKLFLKWSERKAYSTGLMAELLYWRQSERRMTMTRVLPWS